MITQDQLKSFVKKYKMSEPVIAREYLQLLFLSKFYGARGSQRVFFKGGTAIHLLFGAPRFSEDLDFTVELKELEFSRLLQKALDNFTIEVEATLKPRKTITGKRYSLQVSKGVLSFPVFITLDFSFREKVLSPQYAAITTEFPVVFTSFVYYMSKEELLAEKIRALLTRRKGRDLYDLWYLVSHNTRFDDAMVEKKLTYYGLTRVKKDTIFARVNEFPKKEFVLDLRPFVPLSQRERLQEFYEFVKEFLKSHL